MFEHVVVIKGGGDLATGVAYRLYRSGFRRLALTEIARPTVIRRTVSFAEAVYSGETTVEGLTARRCPGHEGIAQTWAHGAIPVLVDPKARVVQELRPTVVVDAIMAKRNLGTSIGNAPIVVALGPGFYAGRDCHAVIETNRGHYLGRVILQGEAQPNTGVPGDIDGYGAERVVRAPREGVIRPLRQIGDRVAQGEALALVEGEPVPSPLTGVLRGLIREGLLVKQGMKIGDVDPRAAREHCFTISDKSLAVGGGVLEAVLLLLNSERGENA